MKRRERPKIIFDDDGTTPLYLSNGVETSYNGTFTLITEINSKKKDKKITSFFDQF